MPATGSTSIFGILRAAVRTPAASSAPSINSAFDRPSFSNWLRSALVLASFTLNASMTMMPSSLGFAGARRSARGRRPLLGRADLGPAGLRADRAAPAAEQIDAGGAVTRRAGALLPVHFLAGAVDGGAVLHLMGG